MKNLLLFSVIISSFIARGNGNHCYPRKYANGGGSKGKPNTKINPSMYAANKAICNKITDAIKCAQDHEKICLWSKDDELFESPTVKSIKFIPTEMMGDDEWLEAWQRKGDVSGKPPGKPASVPKMATWDGDVVYEYVFTDWEDHDAEMMKVIKESDPSILSNFISEDVEEEEERSSSTGKTGGVEIHPKHGPKHDPKPAGHGAHRASPKMVSVGGGGVKTRRLISTRKTLLNRRHLIERRRLLPTPVSVDDRVNLPYSAVGLIRAGTGSATGTIIWCVEGYIYVLVAAHDLWQWRRMYRTIDEYSFWPSFVGTEQQRLDMLANRRNPHIRRNLVGPMVRSWMMTDWDFTHWSIEINQYDVAILKFGVSDDFLPRRARLRNDLHTIPVANAPLPPIRKMVMYNAARFDPLGRYRMDQQDARLFCPDNGDYCRYENLKIQVGYCGGPILNNNNEIIAMQTAKINMLIMGDRRELDLHSCDRCRLDCSNCGGTAARMSGTAITAFRWIVTQYHLPVGWRVMHQNTAPISNPIYNYNPVYNYFDEAPEILRFFPVVFVIYLFVAIAIAMGCYFSGAISGIACYVAGKDRIKYLMK